MSRNISLVLLAIGAALAVGYWFGRTTTAAAAGTNGKVFEIRTYTAEPGKLDALHSRFRDHTLEIFKKHGMHSVAYFAPTGRAIVEEHLDLYSVVPQPRRREKVVGRVQDGPRVAEGAERVGGQREAGNEGGFSLRRSDRLFADEVVGAGPTDLAY